MNNEPVGVVTEFEGILVGTLFEQLPDGTKLYTTPQIKELSDEEIQDLWAEMDWSGQAELEFAKAILRKAQEK